MAQKEIGIPAQNKIIVRRVFEELLNTGDMDHADELIDYEYKQHSIMGVGQGLEGLRSFSAAMRASFPDLTFKIEDMIAEDDRVAVRVRTTGTQTGEFMGKPPSGKSFDIVEIDIFRLSNGIVVEHWDAMDQGTMLRQLGLQ